MSAPRSARQSLIVNLALAAGVSVLCLGLLEWGARAWERHHPRPARAEYLWDWEQMWQGDFYTVGSGAVGWPPWEEFNSDGLRDGHHAEARLPRVTRVAVLGDSVAFGDGLEPRQAFPQLLQQRFEREGRPVEVFNVALWGWSTRQQRLAWENIARRYRPDVAVLAVCLNDIPELQNNLARPPAWLHALFGRLALVRVAVDAQGREIGSVEEFFTDSDSRRVREAFERFFAELRALREAVRADGARLAVVVLPFRFQLEPGAPSPRVQQRLRDFAQAEGLPFLDLLPALRPHGPASFRDYDHLSADGAQVVAETLATAEWFPRPATWAERLGDLPRAAWGRQLRAADAARREAAARLMARGAPDAGETAALLRLLGDDDSGVRAAAAGALGEARAPEAAPALFAALQDRHEAVRAAAARALATLRPAAAEAALASLTGALASDDAYVRGFAAWMLGELGPRAAPAVPALAAALERESEERPGVAAQALAKVGASALPAVPALCAVLKADQPRRRWNAAMALGRVGPAAREGAVAPLRDAARDPDGRVRAQAVLALGRLRASDAESVEVLARALGDEWPEARALSARALGWLGAPARPAVPALNGRLRDEEPRVRREAEKALRRIQLGLASGDEAIDDEGAARLAAPPGAGGQ